MSIVRSDLRATVEDAGNGPGYTVVRTFLLDEAGEPVSGAAVRIWSAGWPGDTQLTGASGEESGWCEFGPLGAGSYTVEAFTRRGSGAAQVTVGANQVVNVRFRPAGRSNEAVDTVLTGCVSGAVTNGEGSRVRIAGAGVSRELAVQSGRYRIEGLPAGEYQLSLSRAAAPGEEIVAVERVTVGQGTVRVDVVLPFVEPDGSR